MSFVLENDNVVFFDVDDTLVMYNWPTDRAHETIEIGIEGSGERLRLWPHKIHIERLKEFKARGQAVVVWSQGGHAWARAVVDALQIQDYVSMVCSKPRWLYDDLAPVYWLTDRSYVDPITGESRRKITSPYHKEVEMSTEENEHVRSHT